MEREPDIEEKQSRPWEAPFPSEATESDILACFRLLLGRRPNREEWPGHTLRVGEPLDGVVATFLGSLEFARRELIQTGLNRRDAPAPVSVRLPDFDIWVGPDDAAVGRFVRENNYERDVTSVFRRVLRPGMGVLDIGANIGYFALLSASIVGSNGRVVAIEPNPDNVRLLEASRLQNSFQHQLRVVQSAAGCEPGVLILHRDFSNGTTSAAPGDPSAVLKSETVGCVRADSVVPTNQRIDLIKVDVEGSEYLALEGCRRLIKRWRPAIISEFSPSLMPGISGVSGRYYLEWLRGLGYELGYIRQDGSVSVADADEILAEHTRRGTDHIDLFCSFRSSVVAKIWRAVRGFRAYLGKRISDIPSASKYGGRSVPKIW